MGCGPLWWIRLSVCVVLLPLKPKHPPQYGRKTDSILPPRRRIPDLNSKSDHVCIVRFPRRPGPWEMGVKASMTRAPLHDGQLGLKTPREIHRDRGLFFGSSPSLAVR